MTTNPPNNPNNNNNNNNEPHHSRTDQHDGSHSPTGQPHTDVRQTEWYGRRGFGFTLSSEEHGPNALVANGARAEEAGFDFLTISDHYHPWVQAQGHSPFVWGVLGALGQATAAIPVGVGVTCPTVRVHPAIVAQASATASLLLEGRFFLGVGSGEALNEHIVGAVWPRPEIRLEMLEEAVQLIRRLWQGRTVDHTGRYYTVDNARLFDPPSTPPPVIVSGFGPRSTALAARIGDGFWGHPDPELLQRYRLAGGQGPRFAQLNVCFDTDASRAREIVHRMWPNGAVPGQLSQDLPTWTHFEQAAGVVSEEEAVSSVPCGPDIEPILTSVRTFLEAGCDHIHFHQIGPNQQAFLDVWRSELADAVREVSADCPERVAEAAGVGG